MIDIDMSKIKPYERSVYYYETDRMQIVHHSNYIRWIEEARLDWMRQIGWDYKSIEDDGYIIPVLGVTAEYKSMCHFGDDVLIHVSLSEYTGVRVGFSYEVVDKKTGELRTLCTSSHCLLDGNNKLVFIRKAYPEHDKLFKELLEDYKKRQSKRTKLLSEVKIIFYCINLRLLIDSKKGLFIFFLSYFSLFTHVIS